MTQLDLVSIVENIDQPKKQVILAHIHISIFLYPVFVSEPLWLNNIHVNLQATERQANELSTKASPHDKDPLHWALKALSLTDLTTLAGDDTKSNVQRLCRQAAFPFALELQTKLKQAHPDEKRPHTAAVCVYPSRVSDAREVLQRMQMGERIQIAAGE